MVIDSSIIMAIFLQEPMASVYADRIAEAPDLAMSVASYVECGIKLIYVKGEMGIPELELFVLRNDIQLVPVDEQQASIALRAFEKYGKGRHKAALNFGDCYSYALAKVRGEPLFYQGTDFAQTDLA
jgi:ribonuclease VapC